MIRLASERDLPAIAAIYEAILDHEDATGLHYTGWQRGAYPTLDTAKGILAAGTLYVGTDEDGTVWGSMNFNDWQLPEYAKGRWTIPAEDSEVAVIHTLTIDPKRAGREDRHHQVERGPRRVYCRRAGPQRCGERFHGGGGQGLPRYRAGRSVVPRHRQGGAERPSGGPPYRL